VSTHTFRIPDVLEAVRRHLSQRHVVTLATARNDEPWAASSFYVTRDLDLFVCQSRRARTLAHMRANPRTAFAVDDRKADAWLQGLGTARVAPADDERWVREQLLAAAPEFTHHFTNPEYPVLVIQVDELTFADRAGGIYPRQHLVLRDGAWRFAE
jgi:uncharacterized protein YhbP (UPF0306 family)